jgi:quinol-cytochrome oxidoreductase complex cytochrome b subunit
MTIFAAVVFYAPDFLGHPDNYIDLLTLVKTPAHIVPEWYLSTFLCNFKSSSRQISLELIAMLSVLF